MVKRLLPIITICMLLLLATATLAELKAFPTAVGFGKDASGGRGGRVIKVTNLNDAGAGSFREAVTASGPRTVVFDVGGTIQLKSSLSINNGDLTIAGETAPADSGGITIAGAEIGLYANNIIIRHVRFRHGDGGYKNAQGQVVGPNGPDDDTLAFNSRSHNIIIDHASVSWSIDENFGMGGSTSSPISDITVQNSIISEALANSHHTEGGHSMGFLLNRDVKRLTVYGNLFAHNRERNIRAGTTTEFEMINNLAYNFRAGTFPSAGNTFSVINNHYKEGYDRQNIDNPIMVKHVSATGYSIGDTSPYIKGNTFDFPLSSKATEYSSTYNSVMKSSPPISSGINPMSTNQVENYVLNNVGTRVPFQDAVDKRIIQDYKSRTGRIIDTQAQVGGYPSLAKGTARVDTDNDGIADNWESNINGQVGRADNNGDHDGDGYTNLEEYLHYLAGEFDGTVTTPPTTNTPVQTTTSTSTQTSSTSIIVSSVEILELGGDGFVVGYQTNVPTTGQILYGESGVLGKGTSIQASRTTEHQIQVSGLTTGTVYFYRVTGTDVNGNTYESQISLTRTYGVSSGQSNGNTNTQPTTDVVSGELKAFPAAYGAGAYATGGRGGRVIKVTNLNDAGSGSLREAIQASGKRIIVFDVSGTIELQTPLQIRNGDLTIAGQTAPNGGITLTGEGLEINRAENIIIRHLRVRPNYHHGGVYDTIQVVYSKNLILDHVSASWGGDEAITFTLDTQQATLQNSLMAESKTGSIMGQGSLQEPGKDLSIHRNLYVDITHRFPNQYVNDRMDVINNVVHNWKFGLSQNGGDIELNSIGNYYSLGCLLTANGISHKVGNGYTGEIYTTGNYVSNGELQDDWDLWEEWAYVTGKPDTQTISSTYRVQNMFPLLGSSVPILSAQETLALVTSDAGASKRLDENGNVLDNTDSLDMMYRANTKNNKCTQYVSSSTSQNYDTLTHYKTFHSSVSSTPLATRPSSYDTDNDGMPDAWERNNGMTVGVDDSANDNDNDGYTNIEEFINLVDGAVNGQSSTQPTQQNPTIDTSFGINNFYVNQGTSNNNIRSLQNGDTVDIGKDEYVTIWAFGSKLQSAVFYVNGNYVFTQNNFPNILDTKYYNTPGTYTFRVRAFDTDSPQGEHNVLGAEGVEKSITLNIIDSSFSIDDETTQSTSFGVNGFYLNDGTSGDKIRDISADEVIDLASLPDNAYIAASTFGTTESVIFYINGYWHNTENGAPWTFFDGFKDLGVGTYYIQARSYDQDGVYENGNNDGTQGVSSTLKLNVINSSATTSTIDTSFGVSGFYLNQGSANDARFRAIQNGDVIDLATLPADTYISVSTFGTTESVVFYQNGGFHNTENGAPWTFYDGFGDIPVGTHNFVARAYNQDGVYENGNNDGTQGVSKSITIKVINSGTSSTTSSSSTTTGQMIFENGFEGGTADWTDKSPWRPESINAQVVSDAREGNNAVRFLPVSGKERSELVASQNGKYNYFEWGKEYWVGFSMKLNKAPTGYKIIQQHHAIPYNEDWSCTAGANGFSIVDDGSNFNFLTSTDQSLTNKVPSSGCAICGQQSASVSRNLGQWYDVVMHFKYSENNDGFYEIWVDGKKVVDKKNIATVYKYDTCGNLKERFDYLKIGLYYGAGSEGGEILYDAFRIWQGTNAYDKVKPLGSPSSPDEQTTNPTPTPSPTPSPTQPSGTTTAAKDIFNPTQNYVRPAGLPDVWKSVSVQNVGSKPTSSFQLTSASQLTNTANANKVAIVSQNINLGGATITPVNGIWLQANGGVISNGKLAGSGFTIDPNSKRQLFTTSTTFSSLYRKPFYVEFYGAKGNDASDDTAAIKASIDASSNVYFQNQRYLVSRMSLSRSGDVKLTGNGATLESLKTDDYYYMMDFVASFGNVEVHDLVIDGKERQCRGIRTYTSFSADNLEVRNLYGTNWCVGFYMTHSSSSGPFNVALRNVYIHDIDVKRDGQIASSVGFSRAVFWNRGVPYDGTYLVVENSRMGNIFGDDGDVLSTHEGSGDYTHDSWLYSDNSYYYDGSRRLWKTFGSNVNATRNRFEAIPASYQRSAPAAGTISFGTYVGVNQPVRNLFLHDNIFDNTGEQDTGQIYFGNAYNIIMTGNSFLNTDLNPYFGTDKVRIENNEFVNAKIGPYRTTPDIRNVVVRNNEILYTASRVGADPGNSAFIQLWSNGIYTNWLIENNILTRESGASDGGSGILSRPSSSTYSNVVERNNVVK